ncbi:MULTISPECIES: hypothetical protein [Paraburkholderia]|uniref:hypothetical protein n=1 Tax=Paraburkholderia TaxID=1822464 RepID=UPI0022580B98|nr:MULTISPECIES: hypothetical protein [Paraburkholderia]MCX4159624.1 hypothetical protein [Paraburkholderia aspalathi]MDN7169022.1 hypothetical protein [Paraburkholderia sp. SECH2]MDQ6397509.1 hypothetical protein [Paraburkholderia aspalathi]
MPYSFQLRLFYKCEALLGTLRAADEGTLILLLSEDAAILEPLPLDKLMAARDYLLVRTATHAFPQVDVQIWRNTVAVRDIICRIVDLCRVDAAPLASEADLFADLESSHSSEPINGVCAVGSAASNFDPVWNRTPTFSISIDDAADFPRRKDVSARYRDILVEHINQRSAAGLPRFRFTEYDSMETAERSVYNPGHAIALTTLYTPNIASYGRIAEHNLRRYCELHGYTLYMHREVPSEIGVSASGNWIKP